MPKNNARRWMVISVIITVISFFMIVAGFVLDDYNYYWMIMVGLMLGITFFICFFVFLSQARRLDNLFKNIDLLAHWRFEPAEQRQKVETEYRERKSYNKMLIAIMTFFFVVIGGIFIVFGFDDPDDALFFFLMMLGILILLFVVAFTAPVLMRARMKKSPPEVFVGPFGAWVMGEYTQWNAPMTTLTDVALVNDEETGELVIAVNYEIIQRYGPQLNCCRIPVPRGKEAEAREVALKISQLNNVPFSE